MSIEPLSTIIAWVIGISVIICVPLFVFFLIISFIKFLKGI